MSRILNSKNSPTEASSAQSLAEENKVLRAEVERLKSFIDEERANGEWAKSRATAGSTKSIYQSAIESNGLGLWEWSVETGQVFWSDLMTRIMGFEVGEIQPSFDGFMELVHQDDLKKLLDNLQGHLDNINPFNVNFRVRSNNGHYRWFNGRGEAQRHPDGKPIRMVGSLENINSRIEIEQALEKERARYSAIFSQSKDAWMTLEAPSFKFIGCNEAALQLFHLPSEEALRTHGPWDLSPKYQPDGTCSQKAARNAIEIAMDTGTHFFEWTHATKDGVELSTTVLLSRIDLDGKTYLHAVVRDITEQKKLERELRVSKERLELALDGVQLGLLRWNFRNNAIHCDQRWLRILGLKAGEITIDENYLTSLIHPEDIPGFEKKWDEFREKNLDSIEVSLRMKHKAGHWVHVLCRGCVVERDENGNPVEFASILFDITKSKEQEKDLSLILERNEIGTWKYDPVNNHLEWGHSMFELYGVQRKNFTNAYDAWSSTLHPECREQAERNLKEAMSKDDSFEDVFSIVTESGDLKYIRARAVFERDESGVIMVRGINADVTREQIAIQQAEQASRVKSEFLANMSHEIRTPMNGISGMLQHLKDSPLAEEQNEIIGVMETSSKNLLSILNDILDLSKMEAGKVRLEADNFDIKACTANAFQLMENTARERNNKLRCSFSKDIEQFLIGDELRIGQITTNLLSNAIKFTENGTVTLRCTTEALDAKNVALSICVEDTGIGMTKEVQDRLFQDFVQADASITRRFGGTGLGLSICSKLAGLMGGSIEVDSQEGVGSTFTFQTTLPIGHREKPKEIQELGNDADFAKQHPQTILLVEDNRINQKVAEITLSKLGYQCDIVNHGKEALHVIREKGIEYYSLIFMDLQMPEMDGFETTQKIFEYYPASAIKIVALTANAFDADRLKCIESGMQGFATKPLDIEELKSVLSS